MIDTFHFLRPLLLLLFIPAGLLLLALSRKTAQPPTSWQQICDQHLLPHIVETNRGSWNSSYLVLLALGLSCLILALAGPTWKKWQMPVYTPMQARVILLDLSQAMLESDIKPSRMQRSQFKLHDIFSEHSKDQFGLVAFTQEPFVISPLTTDNKTITSLIAELSPGIMPVDGYEASLALDMGADLIKKAGFKKGQLLLITAHLPDKKLIRRSKYWASRSFDVSVMPMLQLTSSQRIAFKKLAQAGNGKLLEWDSSKTDIQSWISDTKDSNSSVRKKQSVFVWRDEGRWLIIPALLCFLPFFRRGWLSGIEQ